MFRYEGGLWRALSTLTDIFCLSLLWCLCSLPVITLGASTTALYDSAVRCIRYKEAHPYARFFRTWKRELLTASLTTLLWGAAAAGVIWLLKSYTARTDASFTILGAYYVLLAIPVGLMCWAFPLLSRWEFSFSALNITALKLFPAHLPLSAAIVLITGFAIYFSLRCIFPLTFMPALTALLWSLFIEPVFAGYGGGIDPKKRRDGENTEE